MDTGSHWPERQFGNYQVSIPIGSAVAEAATTALRSEGYKNLSPAGKALVDGYFRTMASIPAYQRVLTNSSRSNKEQLDLELRLVPNPIMAPGDIRRRLAGYQENINQLSAALPKFPGQRTQQEVLQDTENPPAQFGVPQMFAPSPFSRQGGPISYNYDPQTDALVPVNG
jgi:hypothetical protein